MKFGGSWSDEKLQIIKDYLGIYTNALKRQPFGLIYIDAFAGCGFRENKSNQNASENNQLSFIEEDNHDDQEIQNFSDASTRIALDLEHKFNRYIFVELKKKNYKLLNQLVDEEYNDMKAAIKLHNCDANDFIRRELNQINWKKNRGVLFLDPFALSVNWDSLSIIARTKAIDVWYLFPIGALNRMLTTSGKMDITWEKKLNTVLGTAQWKDAFYKEKSREVVQLSFGENGETNTGDPNCESNLFKNTNIASIKDFITKRLEETFAWVSPNPRLLKTEKNTPLFYLFLAVSNPSEPAIDLAKKLAKHTLGK